MKLNTSLSGVALFVAAFAVTMIGRAADDLTVWHQQPARYSFDPISFFDFEVAMTALTAVFTTARGTIRIKLTPHPSKLKTAW